jgi:uncharacterized protein (TIRG00374 family)
MPKLTPFIIGIFISLVLLWFLFRGSDWQALTTSLYEVKPGWIVLSLALAVSSLYARVQRWTYVVRATDPAPFQSMFSATQIGMLVNCVIPARIGDVVRGYVLARLIKIPFTRSITMVALDRINDILALIIVLFVTLLAFPSHRDIEFAAGTFSNIEPFIVSSSLIQPVAISLAIFLTIIILMFVFLYFRQGFVLRALDNVAGFISTRLATGLHSAFLNFAAGMHIFRSAGEMAKSVLFSLLTWGLVSLSLAALLVAFGLDFPWYAPLLMLSILGIFTSVTITPGMVGQYHIPVVASLLMVMPGMDTNEARAVAIVAHLVALLPPVTLGVFSIIREQLRISDLIPEQLSKSNILPKGEN